MSKLTTVDLLQTGTGSSATHLLAVAARSKKLPPPPLCLPDSNVSIDEEKNHDHQDEVKTSINNRSCSCSSSRTCSHETVPYTLPVGQRRQILNTLTASSSVLLMPPSTEAKQKKSHAVATAHHNNLHKQRAGKLTVTDAEWLDFTRLLIHKSLTDDLKLLLDKYKMTYFDRANAPTTNDSAIRSSLCAIVSETLNAYSSHSPSPPLQPEVGTDETTIHIRAVPSTTTVSGSSKRKRKSTALTIATNPAVTINSQTKFVVSHMVPGKWNNYMDGSKTTNQSRQKQFQKKYSHLFRYVPDKDEQALLVQTGRLKSVSSSSSSRSVHNTNSICLMLFEEVTNEIDEQDLEWSGISIDESFTLPESILAHIRLSSSTQ